MVFKGFKVAEVAFQAKIRSQQALWVHNAKVDALFRFEYRQREEQDGFRTSWLQGEYASTM
jgi:hypothetical protein